VGVIDAHKYIPGDVCKTLMEDYDRAVGKA
jgi:hypothetical protein